MEFTNMQGRTRQKVLSASKSLGRLQRCRGTKNCSFTIRIVLYEDKCVFVLCDWSEVNVYLIVTFMVFD